MRTAFRQITLAVVYLHSRFISHNDIKPDNMFIFNKGSYKLADFGFAVELAEKVESWSS